MAARTMARFRRELTEHTTWCTRDHRCGVAEHRSADLIADSIGGRAVITRVRAGDTEYAEIRARIPLHSSETGARWQVALTLRLMRELLAAVAIRRGVLRDRAERPAIERRAA
ncbi:hypothetical protein M1L60_38635 [Actinoplanes sp. TRM 88003]|uniref:Transposase n=1 Tax=Paractinoplanes aksuensis TaxID=2939490 RepID=A0ABT1E048_9ACTN|nr:hypothetical protein [Actinoplanes aksuensis]MCO8276511.1 hypothetical protein [Actinoplanes aksuensis]